MMNSASRNMKRQMDNERVSPSINFHGREEMKSKMMQRTNYSGLTTEQRDAFKLKIRKVLTNLKNTKKAFLEEDSSEFDEYFINKIDGLEMQLFNLKMQIIDTKFENEKEALLEKFRLEDEMRN